MVSIFFTISFLLARLNSDFDLTWAAWGGGVFKDPEPMWFAKYADEKGQNNLAGIKNKEVDALIEKQKRTAVQERKQRWEYSD